ncbi:MAG: ABC-F family ATP-binding cassette domain-containing protein [Oligoflexia bacterium]|nr:ABC-F family ATP-binding cassette domain-containing protein [Oligoflexia bacterium]
MHFQDVSFSYPSQSKNLFNSWSLSFHHGWYGVIGANGSGKTTLLLLATGALDPVAGNIRKVNSALYCPQRTDDPPPFMEDFLRSSDSDAYQIKTMLEIEDEWEEHNRWNSLSHGERKRLQLGVALWLNPALLAIDEPTNHLDSKGKKLILESLKHYRGIGLLVSHDRELLDILCIKCLLLEPPTITVRNGNYTQTMIAIKKERKANRKEYEDICKEVKRIDREVKHRRQEAARSDARVSKRGIDTKDHDAKSKIDLARVSGKDGVSGKLLNQLSGRYAQIKQQQQLIKIKSEDEYGIKILGEISKRDYLIKTNRSLTITMGNKYLSVPSLEVGPEDKIALIGDNGSGKTTLVHYLLANSLNTIGGNIKIQYMPQEITQHESEKILDQLKKLPPKELGIVMSFVNRLGSDPKQLLMGQIPSPGEVRKLLLAQIVLQQPQLLILDEPTNHLDLLSIELLEKALEDYIGALIIISHDKIFRDKLTYIEWETKEQGLNFYLQVSSLRGEF